MTQKRDWYDMANNYRTTLIYIAIVVTIGLVLQTWEVVHGN